MHGRNPLPSLFGAVAILALVAFTGCGSSTSSGGGGGGQTCKLASDCPAGQICTNGMCTVKSTAQDAISSGFDTSSDSSSSTDLDSTASGTDATTQTDTNAGKGAACQACKVDDDCGDPNFQCITLLNGTFCAKKCGSSNECPAAFKCDKADTKAPNSNCLPPNYSCDGCLVTPCDAGQSCVAATGKCAVVKQQCDECTAQLDCADGLKCVKLGATKVCAPSCDSGTCPEMSTCQKTVVGNVCAFQADTCCYGANCQVASACAKCTDKCFGGACVDCLSDSQCTGGKCDPNSHTCITSGACQAPTPIKLADGKCVECTNDTHCAGAAAGNKCDLTNHTCGKGGNPSSECAPCVAPYPGCVLINGTWSCVECTTDADCAAKSAGTCNGTTYSCSGTTGGPIGPTSGNCKSDSDCVNVGTSAFTLACDTASGLCYDTAGKCDNVIAFCKASKGSSCVQPSSVGGLPGLPGGTGANPGEGVCSCGASTSGSGGGATWDPTCDLIKAMDPKLAQCDCNADPNSPNCVPALPLVANCCKTGGSSGGGGTGLPFDLSCLTPTPNPPECFGGLSCTCDLISSITGGGTGTVPKNCGTGGGLGLPTTP